jgi:hypothetical protein
MDAPNALTEEFTMKRFFSMAAALAVLGGSFGTIGCANFDSKPTVQSKYDNYVDGCWPQRYSYEARETTIAHFANHVENGRVLDQFVQNGDFEVGTDKLTPGGLVKLDSLMRKRPANGHIYLQKTRDIPYDASKASDFARVGSELEGKRIVAITTYLNASTAGRNIPFEVTVIDPAEQLMPAGGPSNSIRGFAGRFSSGIGGAGGVAASGVGGQAATANVNPNSTGAAGQGAQGGQNPNGGR